jgi:hypothetical protein
MSLSSARSSCHSQQRFMDGRSSAETHAWFQQGKGIFTGALHSDFLFDAD